MTFCYRSSTLQMQASPLQQQLPQKTLIQKYQFPVNWYCSRQMQKIEPDLPGQQITKTLDTVFSKTFDFGIKFVIL